MANQYTPTDRVGEIHINNAGQQMKIIQYKDSTHVTVMFEDGAIREATYGCILKGKVSHPSKIAKKPDEYLGKTVMMNCGMSATVIDVKNSRDITVKFEDGTIREHVGTGDFNRGQVAHPNKSVHRNVSHIGETVMMNCGLRATIIGQRNNNDIDIQFEDGKIIKNKSYACFLKGGIAHESAKDRHLGETRVMNNGVKATIIEYKSAKHIKVKFETGIIRETRYSVFSTGELRDNALKPAIDCIGETNMMKCGMRATIIKAVTKKDITVQFEDGTIVDHRRYGSFINGSIDNKNVIRYNFKAECERLGINYGSAKTYRRLNKLSDEETINHFLQLKNTVSFKEICRKYNIEPSKAYSLKRHHPELSNNQVIMQFRPDLIENIFGELIQNPLYKGENTNEPE